MLAGIKDILLITTPEDQPSFEKLIGNGAQWGIRISYAVQPKPEGLAQAFLIGENFINGQACALVLGDNIFYGSGLVAILQKAAELEKGAMVFGYPVNDPERYGVVSFNQYGKVLSLEEKPSVPKSNYAIPGLYFYDNNVVRYTKQLKPSRRGELEITDLNKIYLEKGELMVSVIGRGYAWFDTGTHSSLLEATNFVAAIQNRQGTMISCPEEIAWRMKYITSKDLSKLATKFKKNEYGKYLMNILKQEERGC